MFIIEHEGEKLCAKVTLKKIWSQMMNPINPMMDSSMRDHLIMVFLNSK